MELILTHKALLVDTVNFDCRSGFSDRTFLLTYAASPTDVRINDRTPLASVFPVAFNRVVWTGIRTDHTSAIMSPGDTGGMVDLSNADLTFSFFIDSEGFDCTGVAGLRAIIAEFITDTDCRI